MPPADPFAGSYTRIDSGQNSAELTLTPLPDSYEEDVQYYVSGLAIWGADRPYGPNLGTIELVGRMTDERQIIHCETFGENQTVTTLSFAGDGVVTVREETRGVGAYGMHVTFEGTYQRGLSAEAVDG